MDHFVTANAEYGRAQDFFRLRVDEDLHKPLGFAALAGTAHTRHHPLTDECFAPRCAHLALGHAGAPERRVDVERIGQDTIGDAARVVVEQVGDYDLIVVIRSVRERAAAVDVTYRLDTRDIGAQLVVHDDKPAWVRLDIGFIQTQVVCIGRSADGH